MANIEKFEDLEIWKEGMRLCASVYEHLRECKDFGLKDQMQRASVSVPSNIAEGFERRTNKDFIRFLYIAKGSCGELRTQLYSALKIGAIQEEISLQLIDQTRKLSAMLYKFIKSRIDNF